MSAAKHSLSCLVCVCTPSPPPPAHGIRRFGRVPERNKFLGRPSTEEELVYMKSFTA